MFNIANIAIFDALSDEMIILSFINPIQAKNFGVNPCAINKQTIRHGMCEQTVLACEN